MRGIIVCFILILLSSCATQQTAPVSVEDNPAHHYLRGMELIDKGDIEQADKRFERALNLDKDYSPALAGKALTVAIEAGKQTDKGHKEVDVKKSLEYLEKSEDEIEGKADRFIYNVTAIRVYSEAKPDRWLDKASRHYNSALDIEDLQEKELPYYRTKTAAHYFMGVASWKGYEFRKAENSLSKVLSASPGKWHDPADMLYKKVQKIVRAGAQFTLTDVSRKIAVLEQVTKGDVAAMLVDELRLDKFFAGRIPVKSKQPKVDFVPADITDHIFKDEITVTTKWNVRGLQAVYDRTSRAYLFKPQTPIIRKELALILEDIVIKITNDQSLATKYLGMDKSPFPDIPTNAPWFNAVLNMTTRGLMEPDLSGEFRPDAYVNGADLLLSVMKLRNVMNLE